MAWDGGEDCVGPLHHILVGPSLPFVLDIYLSFLQRPRPMNTRLKKKRYTLIHVLIRHCIDTLIRDPQERIYLCHSE